MSVMYSMVCNTWPAWRMCNHKANWWRVRRTYEVIRDETATLQRDIRRERMADSIRPEPKVQMARTSFKPSDRQTSQIHRAGVDGSFSEREWKFIDAVSKAEKQAGRKLRYSELAEVMHNLGWRPPHN